MSPWHGIPTLVTGAGGFIGSHLVETLVLRGADVTAFVRYNSRSDIGLLRYCPNGIRSEVRLRWGDLCDAESVREASRGIEIIFHLGALISIPYSYDAPRQYVDTNIVGTLNVLEAARLCGVSRVVHTSTSEVYGTPSYVPIDEKHPLQGQSPYSATKIAAEKLVESFHRSYQLPVTTIRPFNTYGPRQSARAVLPTIIIQALGGTRISLGRVEPIRDLNFIADTVEGFIAIARCDAALGLTVNVGSGRGISVQQMVQVVSRLMGKQLEIEMDPVRVRPEGSEVERLIADASEATRLFGWRPRTSLDDGLKITVDWFRSQSHQLEGVQYLV